MALGERISRRSSTISALLRSMRSCAGSTPYDRILPEDRDSTPNEDWLENKWLHWTRETRNLEISRGWEHSIPMVVPYDEADFPESTGQQSTIRWGSRSRTIDMTPGRTWEQTNFPCCRTSGHCERAWTTIA